MYFYIALALAVWMAVDSYKRKNVPWGWAIGSFFAPPVFFPLYMVRRNLREGEVREGGTVWNFLRYFIMAWTGVMIVVGVSIILAFRELGTGITDDIEAASHAADSMIVMTVFVGVWFVISAVALIVAFRLRQRAVVERGPTGALIPPSKVRTQPD